MNKSASRILSVLLIVVVFISSGCITYAQNELAITSKGACVMDFDTGEILYEYDSHTGRVPASLTKLVTLYCVYKAIDNGAFSLYDKVPISYDLQNKSLNSYYEDYFPLYANVNYTVDELISAIFTKSSNCAAVALASMVAGNEWDFVNVMRDTLSTLGIKAEFYDCHGLSNNNRIAPVELLKFVRIFLNEHPEILEKTSRSYLDFHGERYKSTNLLLGKYPGIDGLKTGTTTAAGYCFCATAKRGDRRVLSITMFSKSGDERFSDSIKLLDYGFDTLSKRDGVFHTDIRAFFDETEIKAYHIKTASSYVVVKADDLSNCGFDLAYSDEERILYLTFNPEKENVNSKMSYGEPGSKYSDILNTDIKVALVTGENVCFFNDSFNSNGDMMISVDELAGYFGYMWDTDNRSAIFDLK